MTLAEKVATLLAEDALMQATNTARERLKFDPTDQPARNLLIDLLILHGDYEKADSQCNVAAALAPEEAAGFALLRNQLYAMMARRAWFETGAIPEFAWHPSHLDKRALALAVADRAGRGEEVKHALAELENARDEYPMSWNSVLVSDFRDLDDRTPHALEVLTSGGAYLWVDFAKIAAVTFEPIMTPRDLAFRRAKLSLIDGASSSVLLPAVYYGTGDEPKLLLGRKTEWVKEKSGITTGRGQRCFLAGDQLVPFHDTRSLGNAVPMNELEDAGNG
ncbi:type VI secretion system accessory protein TagJ [Chelativorans sp. AA-79]|uniref:type VI secretion system accessory protein TagJ n=1 Tax=Chelativorans sp. AA-79 TaxID=3028735 RepID=UPI0023F75BB2|nr:type VI secretion system accessory protein TagJ [Chelativorans sp. AA-79]WEX08240.1 type VI secretion system accessory protein TagJ [Chelativorans sp. AA-79]